MEDQLGGIIDSLRLTDQSKDINFLDMACAGVMEASATMAAIQSEISPSDYASFRAYFDANPITGEKGPSGLFSAKIPHIEILLKGWATYSGRNYLMENIDYFPQRDMLNLRKSLNSDINLSARFTGNATAQGQLNGISDWLDKFQDKHRKSLRRQLS